MVECQDEIRRAEQDDAHNEDDNPSLAASSSSRFQRIGVRYLIGMGGCSPVHVALSSVAAHGCSLQKLRINSEFGCVRAFLHPYHYEAAKNVGRSPSKAISCR